MIPSSVKNRELGRTARPAHATRATVPVPPSSTTLSTASVALPTAIRFAVASGEAAVAEAASAGLGPISATPTTASLATVRRQVPCGSRTVVLVRWSFPGRPAPRRTGPAAGRTTSRVTCSGVRVAARKASAALKRNTAVQAGRSDSVPTGKAKVLTSSTVKASSESARTVAGSCTLGTTSDFEA